MSASLVGSEMCIRDRVSSRHQGSVGFVSLRPHMNCKRGSEMGPSSRWNTCLLYTSDAADDM
eukprot:9664337-Alexandrium_andersonii.AAC.1